MRRQIKSGTRGCDGGEEEGGKEGVDEDAFGIEDERDEDIGNDNDDDEKDEEDDDEEEVAEWKTEAER